MPSPHLGLRLRLRAEKLILRGDAADAGLRVLDGRGPVAWPRGSGRLALAVAHHADLDAGAAAVWFVLRPHSRRPWDELCLYERDRECWHPLGTGSCTPLDPGLLDGRPSAAAYGPAALLVPGHGGASIAGAGRAENRTRGEWIAAETFRVSTEVREVRVGSGRIAVPWHGYFVAVWRSSSRNFRSARPPIVCLDDHETVLTRLNAGEYVDSAVLRASADI